jgi:hypothetical protein
MYNLSQPRFTGFSCFRHAGVRLGPWQGGSNVELMAQPQAKKGRCPRFDPGIQAASISMDLLPRKSRTLFQVASGFVSSWLTPAIVMLPCYSKQTTIPLSLCKLALAEILGLS